MSLDFYKAFEDKYRGSRELIKSRVEVYLPFILPLKKIYPQGKSLDIGCGRGEWLELLEENGMSATGIDFDEGMLKDCQELNLNVELGDGIAHLRMLEDESLVVISAFHVVEHISFEELKILVKEALRVLKPGGICILETPNPENIKVATEYFYLDPTHIKPIPSKLLSFLPDFYGYERTKIVRLQEQKAISNRESIDLLGVIEGVSPDYAVVTQKKANKEMLENFDDIFSLEIGLPLTELTTKFEKRLQRIETKGGIVSGDVVKFLREKEGAIEKQKESIQYLNNELASAKFQVSELNHNSHHWWLETERLNDELESEKKVSKELKFSLLEAEHWMSDAEKLNEELQSVYKSKSWIVTWPLRKVIQLVKWIVSIPKIFIRWLLLHAVAYVRNHPNLKERLRSLLSIVGISSLNKMSEIETSIDEDVTPIIDVPASTIRTESINQKLLKEMKRFERENY